MFRGGQCLEECSFRVQCLEECSVYRSAVLEECSF